MYNGRQTYPNGIIASICKIIKQKFYGLRVKVKDNTLDARLKEKLQLKEVKGQKKVIYCKWEKPPHGHIALRTDGRLLDQQGLKRRIWWNTKERGRRDIIRNEEGETLLAFTWSSKGTTILCVELEAIYIYEGIKTVKKLGYKRVQVCVDSKQTISCIQWRSRHTVAES
ncbi:hypothetical protein FRX31_006400 [Thalictrum thalictroides]|uniref:RNase H type-1 domain-containing protein n=1 Tax=Thalictrum thalictroides TaxID=46969 RepID=A0A7J6X6L5_THATH|nr:hypothetical protein FRX31_006400 [Thalictrum thalictroides]